MTDKLDMILQTLNEVNGKVENLNGKFETFEKDSDRQFEEIKTSLQRGNEAFEEIHKLCSGRGVHIDTLEGRVKNLENNGGLSDRRRKQMDGTTLGMIAVALLEVWKWIKTLI